MDKEIKGTAQGLRMRAVKGVFWSFIDQFSSQGIGFVLGIILARLLSPADYGLIGMLSIFIAIANSFVTSGFGTALIQKVDRSETDFSTVFIFNLGSSLVFYAILFFSSPYVAAFYNIPLLEPITKIVALNVIINALTIVPRTKLTINIDFRSQTKISITSIVLSGMVGVSMAYLGYGVWSLVIQGLVAAVVQAILLIYFINWRPSLVFSKASYKTLFGFGSKMMASGLLDTVYNNMYALVIGKKFLPADLGYYSRAQQLESLPAQNITAILQRVTFPIFCQIQNEDDRLISAYRKLIRMTSFIVFPLMFLLVAISEPLITVLLTEKWLPAAALFRILCFAGMWYPIHAINLNILQAKGRSDLFLKLEIWKKVLGVAVLCITLPMGLIAMAVGQVVSSFLALFINTYYTGKHFKYGIWLQIRDIAGFLLISLLVCAITLYGTQYISSNWLKLFAGGFVYVFVYLGALKLFNFSELSEMLSMVKKPG